MHEAAFHHLKQLVSSAPVPARAIVAHVVFSRKRGNAKRRFERAAKIAYYSYKRKKTNLGK
jgi:hypothetical protein